MKLPEPKLTGEDKHWSAEHEKEFQRLLKMRAMKEAKGALEEKLFVTGEEVDVLRRTGKTKRWKDIQEGYFPPPIQKTGGSRTPGKGALWPVEEVRAMLRAQSAGAPKSYLKKLVLKLLERRKQVLKSLEGNP
jgi:hypothetical protein